MKSKLYIESLRHLELIIGRKLTESGVHRPTLRSVRCKLANFKDNYKYRWLLLQFVPGMVVFNVNIFIILIICMHNIKIALSLLNAINGALFPPVLITLC